MDGNKVPPLWWSSQFGHAWVLSMGVEITLATLGVVVFYVHPVERVRVMIDLAVEGEDLHIKAEPLMASARLNKLFHRTGSFAYG
ncbi:hypothetical protein Tsubulata_005024 [Turnera subulata]|uniref:Uncharacterized protein n=1 Tax=Turnera subulata TaxID=218843 RepID=A0A9Q0J4L6_9ROSI|nr:hypothetical protein Tsubulata_005024 [Turnera subulata]